MAERLKTIGIHITRYGLVIVLLGNAYRGGILGDSIGSRVHLPLLAKEAGEEHAW